MKVPTLICLSNRLRQKKGSVILSILASGVVASTIVATHQVTQNFVSGSAQLFNFHTATLHAQRSLMAASLMIYRNAITCSNKPIHNELVDHINQRYSRGCSFANPKGALVQLINPVHVPSTPNLFTPQNSTQRTAVEEGAIILNSKNKKGEHQLKPGSPFYGSTVTWKLRSWHEPAVRAVFGSITKGYYCQNKSTLQIMEDTGNDCVALGSPDMIIRSRDEIQKERQSCGGGQGVCNYFSASDNDDQAVLISVEVPYSEVTSEDTQATKTLTLNAVVRRPIALTTTYIGKNGRVPSCTFECETVGDGGTGLNLYRQCAGLSDAGNNKGADPRYPDNTTLTQNVFYVKNHGPGVLYNARFKREDIENGTNRVLLQTITSPIVSQALPSQTVSIQDKIPCYLSSIYPPSSKELNSACEATRTAHRSTSDTQHEAKRTKATALQTQLKNILGDLEVPTSLGLKETQWVATTNSSMSQVKKVGNELKVFPLACTGILDSASATAKNAKGVSTPTRSATSASHHPHCTSKKGGLAMIKQPAYPLCNYIKPTGVNITL